LKNAGIDPARARNNHREIARPGHALDKTGTLTHGRVALPDTRTLVIDRPRALAIAASLEASALPAPARDAFQ
jgi:hypothetical protein